MQKGTCLTKRTACSMGHLQPSHHKASLAPIAVAPALTLAGAQARHCGKQGTSAIQPRFITTHPSPSPPTPPCPALPHPSPPHSHSFFGDACRVEGSMWPPPLCPLLCPSCSPACSVARRARSAATSAACAACSCSRSWSAVRWLGRDSWMEGRPLGSSNARPCTQTEEQARHKMGGPARPPRQPDSDSAFSSLGRWAWHLQPGVEGAAGQGVCKSGRARLHSRHILPQCCCPCTFQDFAYASTSAHLLQLEEGGAGEGQHLGGPLGCQEAQLA